MKTTADQIRELTAAGKTTEEIIEKLNVTPARIKKILARKSRSEMKKVEVPYDPKPPVTKAQEARQELKDRAVVDKAQEKAEAKKSAKPAKK